MILVAEDHHDTRRALVRLLQACGYETVGVENGAQAILYLQTSIPDLVVLDQMMPIVTGTEVLRQMRQDVRLEAIPVIIYSAVDRGLLSEGPGRANDYIRKGAPWSEFLARVERFVGPPRRRPGAAARPPEGESKP